MPYHFKAPAKLNLFLHVLGRRADGYHDLQTLFQLVDLCDGLGIAVTTGSGIGRARPVGGGVLSQIPESADLALRAARLLQSHTGCRRGATIDVGKRIPAGGGLGGGSSDAATVLLALNRLWSLDLPLPELAALGATLGSDVPVFVHGQNAWAEGRGERLQPVELPQRWYFILWPGVSVSTAEIFQSPELTRNSAPITIADFLAGAGRNDCEPVVRQRYPEVAAALDWLGGRATARLTGTGSCLFAAFQEEAAARQVAAQLPSGWTGFVAAGLAKSPAATDDSRGI